MSLEYIYVTRHGFRSNWVVDPATGGYTANFPTPTGIAADPALTSHGVDQARQLAAHLARRDGDGRGGSPLPAPIERIYCSPYYRCLETIRPFVETVQDAEAEGGLMESRTILPSPAYATSRKPWWAVRCDPGLVDWFGAAPFEQPQPAPVPVLRQKFFSWIDVDYEGSGVVPLRKGETMAQLHARMAAVLGHIIQQCDRDGVRAIVICSHAAPIIAMGRALTGDVPFAVETEDFGTFTCGLSTFRRRRPQWPQSRLHSTKQPGFNGLNPRHVLPWDDQFRTLGKELWTGGRGVGGGWDCDANCNCEFLAGGEERGCGDDESFAGAKHAKAKGPMVDSGLELGSVVQGRPGRPPPTRRLQGVQEKEAEQTPNAQQEGQAKKEQEEQKEVGSGKDEGSTEMVGGNGGDGDNGKDGKDGKGGSEGSEASTDHKGTDSADAAAASHADKSPKSKL